jgi:hypothetical protein
MTYHEAVERLDILCKGKHHSMTRTMFSSGKVAYAGGLVWDDINEPDGLGSILTPTAEFTDWQQVIDYIEAEMKERGLL